MKNKKHNFNKHLRLRRPSEFRYVFRGGDKVKFTAFVVYFRSNKCQCARLGLSVAKKVIPGAVERNQFKRVIRESFRLIRSSLSSFDIVICCTKHPHANYSLLQQELKQQWLRLID